MSRVVLIHWNTAEGNERAATLRKAGHTAKVVTPKAAADRADLVMLFVATRAVKR